MEPEPYPPIRFPRALIGCGIVAFLGQFRLRVEFLWQELPFPATSLAICLRRFDRVRLYRAQGPSALLAPTLRVGPIRHRAGANQSGRLRNQQPCSAGFHQYLDLVPSRISLVCNLVAWPGKVQAQV